MGFLWVTKCMRILAGSLICTQLQGWVERSDTLWEMVEVNWYGTLFTPTAG